MRWPLARRPLVDELDAIADAKVTLKRAEANDPVVDALHDFHTAALEKNHLAELVEAALKARRW